MPQPLSRAQQRENAAFLSHLAQTGNVISAARAAGLTHGCFWNRRRKYPAFAVEWDAALVIAHASLANAKAGAAPPVGDVRVTFSKSGRRQLRRSRRENLDHSGRQQFLAALSASANVVLSAAVAGYSTNAFYNHRKRDLAFAREWRLALQMGYDRLELAMLQAGLETSFAEDDWRRNDPPAIPPMTANQALQLLYLHQKEARLGGTPEPLRRRKGESDAVRNERLTLMGEHRLERAREQFRIAEAERLVREAATQIDREKDGVTLPDLAQVTGWSKADPGKATTDPTTALFGGWRIKDIPAGVRSGERRGTRKPE